MWEEGVFSSLGNTWGQLSFWHGSHKSRWQCVASFSFLMRNFLCSEKIEVVKGEEKVWRIVCCHREDVERPKGSSVVTHLPNTVPTALRGSDSHDGAAAVFTCFSPLFLYFQFFFWCTDVLIVWEYMSCSFPHFMAGGNHSMFTFLEDQA